MARKSNKGKEEIPFKEVDKTSTNIDAVKAFIADAEKNKQKNDVEEAIPQDIQEMLGDRPDAGDGKGKDTDAAHIPTDPTFENPDLRDPLGNMFVTIQDTDIPVTEMDKTLYLKALLHDAPAMLEVSAANGATARCRALSVYESDLVYLALQKFLKQHENYPTMLWDAQIQQYKLAMQMVEFCGKPIAYLSYESTGGELTKHVDDLIESSQDLYLNTNTVKYGIMLRLMNVFNHKMSRLQEAAHVEDFWRPADTD